MQRDQIPPGTLYLLILTALARGRALHGYEIARSIQLIFEDVLTVEEGSSEGSLRKVPPCPIIISHGIQFIANLFGRLDFAQVTTWPLHN